MVAVEAEFGFRFQRGAYRFETRAHVVGQAGEIAGIRDYCETDVMNTYLVSLRFRLMRGELSRADYTQEIEFVRGELARLDKPHWHEFLAAWPL